ncbi:MAG TPA: PilZ domain-containing protein [Terriglobales bacterium]|nr:PilZ domain-containing protein [Terriglobales bacterium]
MPEKTPTPDSFDRRRRYPRHGLDIRVSVQVFRDGENLNFWGRSSELGMDGIGATLTGELEPGEVVSMELALPLTALPMKLRAIVRYRQGLRHGFEFLTLTTEQRVTVERVCEMLTVRS